MTGFEGFRLSPQQHRVWTAQQARGGAEVPARLTALIEGDLDRSAIERAVRTVATRHEALRTAFRCLPGVSVPVQVVEDAAGALRVEISGAGAGRQMLSLELPALCADAASLEQVLSEIGRACAGQETEGEVLQYPDFAQWQNALLEGEETETGRAFWRGRPAPAPLRLPFLGGSLAASLAEDRPFAPAALPIPLGSRDANRLELVADSLGATPAALLLAAWQALLHRYSAQEEITVGVLAEGRSYEGLENAVGLLAKYLPLACRLDATTTFREAVARAAEVLEETAAWQEFFDWKLVPGGPQLLPAGFDFAELRPAFEGGGIRVGVLSLETPGEPFAVKLSARRKEGTLALDLFYDAGALPEDEARRLAAAFRALLLAAVAEPAETVGRLPLVDVDARPAVIAGAAGPERDWGAGCVHHLIEAVAAERPESPAVVHDGLELTYRELCDRAGDLARQLRATGVGPDSVVAIGMEKGLETLVAILGTFQAGGAYLPLDPALPAERRAFMLEDSGAKAVVTLKELRGDLPSSRAEVICLDDFEVARWPGETSRAPVAPENLAYILYTSGSSGAPKAVQVEHRQLWNYVHAVLEPLDMPPGASWAMVSTFAADLGNTALFPALCTGGVLHVISLERSADAPALAEYFDRHGIDVVKIVPSHLEALLAAHPDARLMPRRSLVLGGEACRWEWIDRLRALAPGCRIVNHYGPTETTVGTSTFRLDTVGPRWSVSPPIGRPLAKAHLHLLDPRYEPVPCWVPAELYVGGAGVSRGYLGRPELTAERFLPDPLSERPGERLYRTGDVARRLPDGSLEFLGRVDDQVKIRGYRVELGEVASALERHPAVSRAEVLALGGAGTPKRLVAWVSVRRGAEEPTSDGLRSFLRDRLPEFMVPAAAVILPALPLTANGKVDRRALPEPRAERVRTGRTGPRNEVEAKLARVWQAVLGLDGVGANDNFFALGGDSILGIQVVARARQEGLVLHPADLFRHQTVAELALVAGTDGVPDAPPQEPVVGPLPLTPIQRRFFELDLPEPHHWNQSVLLETHRPLALPAIAAAAARLFEHHDALRLRFRRTQEGWLQECTPPDGRAPLAWLDLSALPESSAGPAIEAAAAQAQASLDLGDGPLLRVVVFDLGPARPGRLLLTAHHLLVDGVSWRILLDDLGAAYTQAAAGASPGLPPKTSSYRLWAERLLGHAQGPEIAAELDLWQAQEEIPVPPLPRDARGDLPDTEGNAGRVWVELDAEATAALLREVPDAYQSQIQEALLAAFARTMARWTGASALRLELEGHGREDLFPDLDLSRTVGWFTSRFPVVLSGLEEAASPGDTLKSVKEQLRRVPNRGIGYGLLRHLRQDDAARTLLLLPAPEISFNYLGQFDQIVAGESPFAPARESAGPMRSPSAPRAHLLQVDAAVEAGELHVTWVYSPVRHRRETVEALAQGFLAELRGLVDHCRSPEAGGYTPSDFPDLEISQEDLDSILDQVVS